ARAGVLLEALALRGEILEALPVGVANDRHEQSVLERDREPDVRRLARHELPTLEARTEPRVLAERLRRRRDDGVRVRRAGCLALLVGHGHVDVARDGELRLLAHALGHALPDGAPHPREGLPLFTGRSRGQGRLCGGRSSTIFDISPNAAAAHPVISDTSAPYLT